MEESEEELKSCLMWVKEESEKAGLKYNIQKTNILVSSPITWWQIEGEKVVFPDSSLGKESACNAGDPGSIPGWGRSPGKGIGYPLQYSWVSLVAQLVKNLPATWETWVPWVRKIPWRRERLPTPVLWPGEFHGLYSPWGRRVGHDWATFTSLHFNWK